jgi:hypothetical protein
MTAEDDSAFIGEPDESRATTSFSCPFSSTTLYVMVVDEQPKEISHQECVKKRNPSVQKKYENLMRKILKPTDT